MEEKEKREREGRDILLHHDRLKLGVFHTLPETDVGDILSPHPVLPGGLPVCDLLRAMFDWFPIY